MVSNVLTSWRCNKPCSQQARRRRGATSSTLWWTSCCYDPLGPTQDHEEDTAQNRSEPNEQIRRKLSHPAQKPFICKFLGLPARTSFLAAWWVCSASSPLGCCLCGRPPGRQQLHFQRWRREEADAHGRPALSCHGGGRGKEILPKSSMCECKEACSQPSWVNATVHLAQHVFLTFIKESHSQHQPIQGQGSNICGVNDQRDDPRQAKEEVHGGVLPVHYIFPVLLCGVVQLESWPVSKLLGQNPWSAQHTLLIYTVLWPENCPCQYQIYLSSTYPQKRKRLWWSSRWAPAGVARLYWPLDRSPDSCSCG